MHVSAHTALPFAWILVYSVSRQHQHTPLFLSHFLSGSASMLPPKQRWFRLSCLRLSDLAVPLKRSSEAITAVRRVIPCLRHHAGIAPCLGYPVVSADRV